MIRRKSFNNIRFRLIKRQVLLCNVIVLSILLITTIFIPVIKSAPAATKTVDIPAATKTVDIPAATKTVDIPAATKTVDTPVASTDSTPTTKTANAPAATVIEDTPTADAIQTTIPTTNANATAVEKVPDASIVSNSIDKSVDKESIITNEIKINASVVKSDTNEDDASNQVILESTIGTINKTTSVSVSTNNQEKEQTIIQKVKFTVSDNQKNVKLTIKNLESKPDEVNNEINVSHNKKLFKYVDVKLTANDTYIGETGIASMTFTFSVEKSWIENENIDEQTVQMIRYHNDSWQELNTTVLYENETHVFYQAETPGLSVFAVVGDTLVEDSGSIVDGSTIFPWYIPFFAIVLSTTLLVIVLVKKRYIYFN